MQLLKVKSKNEVSNETKEINTYKEAFSYVTSNKVNLTFSLLLKDEFMSYGYGYYDDAFIATDKLLSALSSNDFDNNFIQVSNKWALNINEYSKNIYCNLDFNKVSSKTELSDDAKVTSTKIKEVINLLNFINKKIGDNDFINYYVSHCKNKEKVIENITSVIKVFDELRKLILKLFDDYYESQYNSYAIGSNQINSYLDKIISK